MMASHENAVAAPCGFLELGIQHSQSRNHRADLRVFRRLRWSIPRHQGAQFHRASAHCVQGFEAFHKPLARVNSSEPPCASETVTDGDMAALDGLGGVPAAAMQSRTWRASGMTVTTAFTYGW